MTAGLRVASFNIRNGRALDGRHSWPLRRRATAAAIAALHADVVGLQEVYWFQRRWLAERLPDYRAHGRGRDGGRRGEACPVLVRRATASVLGLETRWYGWPEDRPAQPLPGATARRIATLARIGVAGIDGTVLVVSTHLDERIEANRVRSAEQLATWLDLRGPVVVLGDLNAPPGSATLEVLEGAGLRDALGPSAGGTAHSFTGVARGPRIDHVLVSAGVEVVGAGVAGPREGRLPSDHWPVWAEVRLPGGQ